MDKVKNSLIIAAYVLLVTVFFLGGYAFGSRTNTETVTVSVTVTPAPRVISEGEPKKTGEESRRSYTVIIENGRLCLFKEENNERTLISSEEISENIYPAADIRELKAGINFDSMEKAQELFENFVS